MAFGLNWFGRKKQHQPQRQEIADSFAHNNPNYNAFNNIDANIAQIINSHSIITHQIEQQNSRYANPSWQLFTNHELAAMPLATSKVDRLN